MKIIETIILGIIQGIAEFLPISSSAHLIIFRDLFGIGNTIFTGDLEQAFDIALHLGTLLAILVFFFKDWLGMITNGIMIIFNKKKMKSKNKKQGLMLWMIAVATIPAALFGVLLDEKVESFVRDKFLLIAICLAVMGIIIRYSDKLSKSNRDLDSITFKDSIIIGFSQVCALIPGFSRSGTTIAAARILKLDRESAAKFSFYLSMPVVCGAVVLKLIKGEMISLIVSYPIYFVVGLLSSFIMGLICIKFLLKYLKSHDYQIFMWYRLALSLAVMIVLLIK